MSHKTRGLGKGLEDLGLHELLAGMGEPVPIAEKKPLNLGETGLHFLPLNRLTPGIYQPRQTLDDETLLELAQSIKAHGIIQPILVRETSNDNYEIIAGERRWRAAKLANLQSVPVIIKDMPNNTAAAVALIENIQRENLNVIDEAYGIKKLLEEFDLTHQSLSGIIGKSRSAITNTLRILDADTNVLDALKHKKLNMGHARALLSLPKERQAYFTEQIIIKDLSVRNTEQLVNKSLAPTKKPQVTTKNNHPGLSAKFNTDVSIETKPNGDGKVTIKFKNSATLNTIIKLLSHA